MRHLELIQLIDNVIESVFGLSDPRRPGAADRSYLDCLLCARVVCVYIML